MTSDELIQAGVYANLAEVLDAVPLELLDDFSGVEDSGGAERGPSWDAD